jgi:hypothetical protein
VKAPNTSLLLVEAVLPMAFATVNASRHTVPPAAKYAPPATYWPALPPLLALPGTLPDREVARPLGRSLQAVTQKRIKPGIANPLDRR